MPGFEQTTQLKQQQSVVLSQKQRQALELLHLPLLDLESRLRTELENNPLLEEFTPESTLPAQESNSESGRDDEPDFEDEAVLADRWSDELPLPSENSSSDSGFDLISNTPAPEPALWELLTLELDAADIPEKLRPIVDEMIFALDDDGYFRISLADFAMCCDAELDDVENSLMLVQQLAPPGIGARTLAESLKLQLSRSGELDEGIERFIDEALDIIGTVPQNILAQKLNISVSETAVYLNRLRSLDPAPGRKFQHRTAAAVIPELEIRMTDNGTYQVVPLREHFRTIIVSPLYEKLLETPDLPEEDRKYMQEKLARARELVSALTMRDSTLKRLGEVIVETQSAFLAEGVEKLRPLTMKTAATALELNESTISRAAADKYIRTPQGVFPLRYFFSAGYDNGNEALSQRAVMEKIRLMIASEKAEKPLSDDQIAKALNSDGLNIARRTVAKYREALKIPSSSVRKKRF